MNDYLTAFEGMPALLENSSEWIKKFSWEAYPTAFEQYCSLHKETLRAVEKGYLSVIDKEQFLTNMAEKLADTAESLLQAQPKKNAREKLASDLNLCMVSFVIPAVLETKYKSADAFSKKILDIWKKHFPKTNLRAADFEQINSGFKRNNCYITTAVCRIFGKPDDCYELNLFRRYRDQYLLKRADGEQMVKEYYDLAPSIIKHIDQQKDSLQIYQEIWDRYLQPCMTMIENGQNEECMELYVSMVRTMQQKYFLKEPNRVV